MYRKGRALENINKIDEAIEIYKNLIILLNDDKLALQDLEERITNCQRKKQNLNGIFDFKLMFEDEKAIFEGFTENRPFSNEFKFESYYNNNLLEIVFSQGIGTKIIAKEDIKEGQLLMVDKPSIHAFNDDPNLKNVIKNKIEIGEDNKSNPDNINKLAEVFDNYTDVYRVLAQNLYEKLLAEEEKFNPKVSTIYNGKNLNMNFEERDKLFNEFYSKDIKNENFKKVITEIIYSNSILSLRNKNSDFKSLCYGLWERISYLNHNCQPNAFYFGIGPYIILKSIENIKKGDEITINYVEPKLIDERKFSLKKWNIVCTCDLCKNENSLIETEEYKFYYQKINEINKELYDNNIRDRGSLVNYFNKPEGKDLLSNAVKYYNELKSSHDNKYWYPKFILYKLLINLFTTDSSPYPKYRKDCFESCLKLTKSNSKREYFEVLINYYLICKSMLDKTEQDELKNEIILLGGILFFDDKDLLSRIIDLN